MTNLRRLTTVLGAVSALAIGSYATPASAQATRTWVSGVGDDVNPCSRTAPCKTFAGAISKTAAGGEINCLDPAGFGAVNITKSLTIDCTGTLGGILASSTTGIIVNGAGIIVNLRGLEINGGPPNLPGVNGVRYLNGARLNIQDSTIYNFTAATPNGFGIMVNNTAGQLNLTVTNTAIIQNGAAAGTGGGIRIQPTVTGSVRATLDNVRIVNNAGAGLHVSGDSIVMLVNSTLANNVNFGILTAAPGSPTIRVGNTTITGNGTGVGNGGGLVNTYGTNRLNGNNTDGAFNLPIIQQQ